MMKILLILTALISLIINESSASLFDVCKKFEPMADLDASRYGGKWYDHLLDAPFSCSQAYYNISSSLTNEYNNDKTYVDFRMNFVTDGKVLARHEVLVKHGRSGYMTRYKQKTDVPLFFTWLGFRPRDVRVVVLDSDYDNYLIGTFCDESPYWFNEDRFFVQVRDPTRVTSEDQPLAQIIEEKVMKLHEKYEYKPKFNMIENKEACEALYDPLFGQDVIPDYLATKPQDILTVKYKYAGLVNLGNELKPNNTREEPQVWWVAKPDTYYTLLMADSDIPTISTREFSSLHWVVVNIPGNRLYEGELIKLYRRPGTQDGQGFHRYVFAVYEQKNGIQTFDGETIILEIPDITNDTPLPIIQDYLQSVGGGSIENFVADHDLGDLVAVNFFKAQYDKSVPCYYASCKEN